MAAVLQSSEAPSWMRFITDFDATKDLFDQNYAGLVAMGPYIVTSHPELQPEYNRMVEEARGHQATLNKLQSIKNTVSGWLSTIGNIFTAPTSGWQFGEYEDDALGIIPIIIGVAAATSALAVIGYWIKDAYQFSRRLNELQRLENRGMTSRQAAAIVDKTVGSSGGGIFGIDLKWLVIGGAVLVFGPAIFRLIKAARS